MNRWLDIDVDKTYTVAEGLTAHVLVADVSPLTDERTYADAAATLSQFRQDKARQFKHPAQQRLSVGAGLLLDMLLEELGLREHDMLYSLNSHDKPAFSNATDVQFNISHSSSKVAAAMMQASAEVASLGIDIQRTTKTRLGVAHKVFTPEDYLLLSQQPEGEARDALFTHLWTEYEAHGKAQGIGLTWPAQAREYTPHERMYAIDIHHYHATLCVIINL